MQLSDLDTTRLTDILHSHFHLKSFRKGQLGIIESVLNQKDTLAVMPTGGGKSLCYQLPSLYLEGLVIVVSPLIALMNDQVRILRQLGMNAGCLHSGQDLNEKRKVFAAIKAGSSYILYLSPERVQNPGFAAWIKTQKIVLFAIDEAHCVSEWGPDFREDYHKLKLLRDLRPDIPILALTATATPTVLKDVGVQLNMKNPDRHVHGFYRPNLYCQVEICGDDDFKIQMLISAVEKAPEGRVLIYCGTRQKTEDIAALLAQRFSGVDYYHAGLESSARKKVQERIDRREVRILAATNAFGMGIDYPDVRLVAHFQMPANIESYYQEMGRAGRDGNPSVCLLLYSKKDKGLQSYFIQQSNASKAEIQRRWDSLNAITLFSEGGECRQAGILTYFKDSERIAECGHCDICAPHSSLRVPRPEIVTKKSASQKALGKLKRSAQKSQTSELDGPQAEARSLILKDWRLDYAKKNDIPAFMVFSNRTLIDLANKNPSNLVELSQIYGFGPVKVDLLGPTILKELGHNV